MSDTKWHDAPAIPQELRMAAEIERLTAERDAFAKEAEENKMRVITCGVAAEHSDANLTRTGAYAKKWNSAQAESVRKLRDERDELRGLIDAHNADCIARCEAMSTQAGHAGVCSHYTNRGRTCPNCPRDEMIAQADAAMGLTRPAEE